MVLPTTPVDPAPVATLPAPRTRKSRAGRPKPAPQVLCGFRFEGQPEPQAKKAPPPKRPRLKNDPVYVAAARELRDRWLEEVERDPSLILPQGKYDLARALPETGPLPHGRGSLPEIEVKALPEAA